MNSQQACCGASEECCTPCCLTGEIEAITSGPLFGDFAADDYTSYGGQWVGVGDQHTAGAQPDAGVPDKLPAIPGWFHFVIQFVAPYQGKSNCGRSQTITFRQASELRLRSHDRAMDWDDGTAALDKTYDERHAPRQDPWASLDKWKLLYADCNVTWLDAPTLGAPQLSGELQSLEFTTCFHSADSRCAIQKTCMTWRLDADLVQGSETYQQIKFSTLRKWHAHEPDVWV